MKMIPRFLKKIEGYLLKKYPNIWCLQLHWLIPFFTLTTVLLFLLLYLQAPDTYQSNNESIVGWLYVISFAGLVVWLVYMLRFNPLKSYGNRPRFDELKNYFITFIGVTLLVAMPMIYFVARFARTHTKFEEKTLVAAINNINLGLALNHSLTEDSSVVNKSDTLRHRSIVAGLRGEILLENSTGYYPSDSIYIDIKADSTLHCYSMSQFKSIYVQYLSTEKESTLGYLDKKQIYYQLQKIKSAADTVRIYTGLENGMKLFGPWHYSAKLLREYSRGHVALNRVGDSDNYNKYNRFISDLDRSESLIDQNMEHYYIQYWNSWPDVFHVFYYLIFYITLFIIIFRNTTLKTFMISLGVGGLLPIIIGLLAVALNINSENEIFGICITVYLTFLVLFMATSLAKHRTLTAGIALNALMILTPILGWFFAEWWIQYYKYTTLNYEQLDLVLIQWVRIYGEISGMVVFFILLQPFFKRAYVRWYSLPEE